jgi:hypothetical protein
MIPNKEQIEQIRKWAWREEARDATCSAMAYQRDTRALLAYIDQLHSREEELLRQGAKTMLDIAGEWNWHDNGEGERLELAWELFEDFLAQRGKNNF